MKARFYLLLITTCIQLTVFSQKGVSFTGKVTDEKSNPIPNATIAVLNTQISVVSDAQGIFTIRGLATGDYRIIISSIGFATIEQELHLPASPGNSDVIKLADASRQMSTVVVTAQKKEENMQEVPISISALTSKKIEQAQIWNSQELTAVVPNFYAANPGDGRNVISIRGITTTSYDPAVTTYVDGVNQFTLDTYIPQLFDVERIEVLRGPQGTLYGRNAMGGVVNIISRQPSNKASGFAEISEGNYGEQRYSAGLRTPIIKDKLYVGAALFYNGQGGFYTNTYNNSRFDKQHVFGGNYFLKYLVNDRWSVQWNLKHMENRNDGAFPLESSVSDALANPFQVNQNALTEMVDNTLNTSLSIRYSGNQFNFSSQTAYQSNYRYYKTPIDGDFSPLDIISLINNYGKKWNHVQAVTQEFKFSSPANNASPWKWTAGTYLFYESSPKKIATHFGQFASLYGSPDSNYSLIDATKAQSLGAAGYAQATYSFSKKSDLILGLRYDYQYSKEEVLGQYQPDSLSTPLFTTQPDTTGHASYSAFSPMASFVFHPSRMVNLFLTYSRGYRTGGLTQLGSDPTQPPLFAYKPEYSDNFELGIKSTLWQNRLRANISLFYNLITDAQVPTLVLPAAITITKNAGSLTSKGLDAEFTATICKGLEASYNFGYTDAKYTSLNLSSNGSAANLDGNRQIFTPNVTSLLALQYTIALDQSQSTRLVVQGDWIYLGKQYFDLANTVSQGSYSLLNARLGVEFKKFGLYVWGKNISNTKYISYAYDFGAAHMGNPQTYGFTLRAAF